MNEIKQGVPLFGAFGWRGQKKAEVQWTRDSEWQKHSANPLVITTAETPTIAKAKQYLATVAVEVTTAVKGIAATMVVVVDLSQACFKFQWVSLQSMIGKHRVSVGSCTRKLQFERKALRILLKLIPTCGYELPSCRIGGQKNSMTTVVRIVCRLICLFS